MNTRILLLLIILFVFYFTGGTIREHVSMGTLTQLMAKGPQDIYLSKDAEKWVDMQYPFGYTNFVWNNPTRLYNNYPYFFYPYNYPYNFVRYG